MVVYILLTDWSAVASGAMGGPGKLFGPTGGYIMSWIPAVILMSWL
ncbi:biotin transporter BioY [Enterocloster sp.]